MSQNINSSEIKELTFIEIIISSWKYKKIFFYIFIILTLFGFLLDNIVPNKIKFQAHLKNPKIINLSLYPYQSSLALVILSNISLLNIDKILSENEKINLNYFNDYFRVSLISSKNLIAFTKKNNEKYNLENYILDNKIAVKDEGKSIFSIILPDNKVNENFLVEYIIFTTEQTLKLFEEDVLKIQKKKIEIFEKDILLGTKILENLKNENLKEQNSIAQNIGAIITLYEAEISRANETVMNFQKLKKGFEQNWIIDGPNKIIVDKNLLKFIKFILPILLSLIIYLLYLLIKLSRLDKQN